MKNLPVALFLLLLCFFSGCQSKPEETKDQKDGLFIHMTHGADDPHRAVMPLKMAVMMADEKEVLVYMDIQAIGLLLKDAPEVSYPTFPSASESIKQLMEKGVGIYACPSCLKAAGKEPSDLIPGVQLANKDSFFSFTQGRIISLDY